jgi:predicted O-linked N-acetylglucosamine transferase (SPINDLY family)
LQPDDAETLSVLGLALHDLGKFVEAATQCRNALKLDPNHAAAHNNLGLALHSLGLYEQSAASCRQAIALRPNFAEAHNNLGNALIDVGQLYAAMQSYRRAIELKPNFAEAHNNLGGTLKDTGQFEASIASYRRAVELRPDYFEAHSNLLFTLSYTASTTPAAYLAEALRYGASVTNKVTRQFDSWLCAPQPQRLRIGFVSGDFCNHPVGYFTESLLAQLVALRVELFAYSSNPKQDELTARIRPHFTTWRDVYSLSEEQTAQRIHQDGIHILIDLAGHTAKNCLPAFAWKPAPVQFSWLGYFASTGVDAMDYLLADQHILPVADEGHFSEVIWRLPNSYLCFTPPNIPIQTGNLPALANGHVTFGSFNNLTKMNEAVIGLWARVLLAVPESRLFLKTKQLNDAQVCDTVRAQFAAHGVNAERLLLEGASPRAELLAAYQRMDIALDPFPYPGGTTSVEALWMGVPVLTRCGDRFLSHMGESILHNAGLPDWIARNDDDYVTKAAAHAADLNKLAALRAGLRQQVLASPLFDAPCFAANFEQALWGMWQNWRTQQGTP